MYVLLLIDAALRSGPAKYGRKGCDRSNPSSHNLTSTCSLSLPSRTPERLYCFYCSISTRQRHHTTCHGCSCNAGSFGPGHIDSLGLTVQTLKFPGDNK